MVLMIVSAISAWAAHEQYYAITGVHTALGSSGARPARRNILDMQNDVPTWQVEFTTQLKERGTN